MRKIHLILILVTALWNVLPVDSPFRPIFDLAIEDPSGELVTTGDPETDPFMINTPPPR